MLVWRGSNGGEGDFKPDAEVRYAVSGVLSLAGRWRAGAQDAAPDFTGTWSGEFDVVIMGRDPGAAGEVKKVTITYDLEHQEGRLDLGNRHHRQDGKPRPIVLAFSLNNGTLVGSDTEGFHRITIVNLTRLESCFTDNGSGVDLRDLRHRRQGAVGAAQGALTGWRPGP